MEAKFILLTAFILTALFGYLVTWLNVRHATSCGSIVPTGFEGHIDSTKLSNASAYMIAKEKVDFARSLISNPIVLIFVFGGFLPLYDNWVGELTNSFIIGGVTFILVITFVLNMFTAPFSIYKTFVVEERFGFNKMTFGLWLKDGIKNTILTTFLAFIIYGGILWFVKSHQDTWWIWGYCFYFAITMLLIYLYPTVIAPLFNKFETVDDEELVVRIKDTANKAGVCVTKVMKMDASKRSGHSNAYFTGIGKNKRVVLFDTLLDQLDNDEIIAVLAHEFGHLKHRHILKSLVSMNVVAVIAFYAVFIGINSSMVAQLLGYEELSFVAQAFILMMLGGLITFPITPFSSWLSRRREDEADLYAFKLTGDSEPLATALIKMSAENLSNLHPHPLYAFINYSHPPVVERVKRLRSFKEA